VSELHLGGDDLFGSQVEARDLRGARVVVLVDAGRAERLSDDDLEIAGLVGWD
jgi:hypothetical protein